MITDIEIVDCSPDLSKLSTQAAASLRHLEHDAFKPCRIRFTLSGVNAAVSNSLVRTAMLELPVKRLRLEVEDIETTDEHIIPELLTKRIRCIPLAQSTPESSTFAVDVTNTSPGQLTVTGADILPTGSQKGAGAAARPLNSNLYVISIKSGRTLRLPRITVDTSYGFIDGAYYLAHRGSAISLDVRPSEAPCERAMAKVFGEEAAADVDTPPEGVQYRSTSASSASKFRVTLHSNGTIDAKEIVARACRSLIERLETVRETAHTVKTSINGHALYIPGETDTIGNVLARAICETGIGSTYTNEQFRRATTLKLACDEPPEEVIEKAALAVSRQYASILSYFE